MQSITDQAYAWTPTWAQTTTRGSVVLVDNDSASYLPVLLRPNPVAPTAGALSARTSHWVSARPGQKTVIHGATVSGPDGSSLLQTSKTRSLIKQPLSCISDALVDANKRQLGTYIGDWTDNGLRNRQATRNFTDNRQGTTTMCFQTHCE